jgi:hypothetical protein
MKGVGLWRYFLPGDRDDPPAGRSGKIKIDKSSHRVEPGTHRRSQRGGKKSLFQKTFKSHSGANRSSSKYCNNEIIKIGTELFEFSLTSVRFFDVREDLKGMQEAVADEVNKRLSKATQDLVEKYESGTGGTDQSG